MSEEFDDETAEMFTTMLDTEGIASIVVDDGVVVGFTSEKLQELLRLAAENKGRIVIHIVDGSDDSGDQSGLLN